MVSLALGIGFLGFWGLSLWGEGWALFSGVGFLRGTFLRYVLEVGACNFGEEVYCMSTHIIVCILKR